MKKAMHFLLFKSHASLFMFTLTLFILHPNTKAVMQLPPNETVPAVIVFGDSIVDTGNNNYRTTIARCNFAPYGKDFEGRIPTGRFGNGKVPPDMIAEELGIKKLVPAYLDPNLQPQDLPTGVCFASGGAGYDPLTSQLAAAISLSDQLELFKEYISKLKRLVGEERTNFILAKSLFVVVVGSDDIANTYFGSVRQFQYDVPAYTDLMVNYAAKFLNDIYELGGRRIGVLSTPPIGCVPSQRTLAGGIQRQCAERYNQAAKLFNDKLSSKVDSLNRNLRNSKIVYVDAYYSLFDLIDNPGKYGFEVVDKGCCGTGIIEVTLLCNPSTPTCPDASKYVFWDSFHPSQTAYTILITGVLRKYLSSFF